MRLRFICLISIAVLFASSFLFTSSSRSVAPRSFKLPMHIQAQAMGTSTQLGRTFSVTAIINEFSPPSDQGILLEAFQSKGNEGLVNALSKMKSKGRLAITGTLGGDLAYIRRWDQPDGSVKIRLVTNRPLRFSEAWSDSRSADYDLTGMDVILTPNLKKSTGTLFPATELKLNKEHKMELELYQNPWNLIDIMLR